MYGLNSDLEHADENECRILLRGLSSESGTPDSYDTISWDHYFNDISHGSFRKYIDGKKYISRRRAWHYLFKNLKLTERIFDRKATEVRILDIGCASGYLRRFLEGNASPDDTKRIFYWGLDVREEMLRKAVHATADLEAGAGGNFTPSAFVAHDVKHGLPFKSGHFDFVINFEMIKYLPIEQGGALLHEVRRVLRKGGELYLSTPTDHEAFCKRESAHLYMQSLPAAKVRDMLESAGLNVIDVYGSQSKFSKIEPAVSEAHRAVFDQLLEYHPREIVAAIFTPLYADAAAQVTFRAR